jgi:hypothetical protein
MSYYVYTMTYSSATGLSEPEEVAAFNQRFKADLFVSAYARTLLPGVCIFITSGQVVSAAVTPVKE